MKPYRFLIFFLAAAILFSCKKNNGDTPILPSDLVLDAVVNPDNSGNVSFTASATNAVSFEYDYGDGTFAAVPSGSVTHKYGESGTYTVKVTAKSATGNTLTVSKQVTVTVIMKLVWSDEFDAPGAPDPTKWGYDLGAGGWGNSELQYYTNRLDNAEVSNGTLKITAKKESYSGSNYTSARLLTKDKFSFKYGKVEARAKLPEGVGTWPAFWMLGSNIATVSWPACGEIDIMEHLGRDLNKIYSTLHYPGHSGGSGTGSTTMISGATTDFHVYAAEWKASSIVFSVDGNPFFTFPNNGTLPFNQNFFIILNVAIGGNFGGTVDPAFTSGVMEVDYVRVYQ